jgi:hypothetical protein
MKVFKSIYVKLVSIYLILMTHPVMARDLESIATNLTTKTNKLAGIIAPIGFAIAGIFMFFGNPRGSQLMGLTLVGGLSVLGGSAIFNWLKNIAG